MILINTRVRWWMRSPPPACGCAFGVHFRCNIAPRQLDGMGPARHLFLGDGTRGSYARALMGPARHLFLGDGTRVVTHVPSPLGRQMRYPRVLTLTVHCRARYCTTKGGHADRLRIGQWRRFRGQSRWHQLPTSR